MHTATENTQTTNAFDANLFGLLTGPRLPVPTGGPVLSIDLAGAIRLMLHEQNWSGHRNAMTLVKHRDLRVVLSALQAGTQLAQHNVRGTALLQVLTGKIQVRVLDSVLEASAGEILSLDANLAHDVKALEDTALLIAIAWPEDNGPISANGSPATESASWNWRADESVWN